VSLDGFLEKLANLSDTVSSIIGEDGPRPGQLAAKQGMKAHHPVVIVPGAATPYVLDQIIYVWGCYTLKF
jgi:hypothetical protein